MLEQFPKDRIELPEDYSRIYNEHYLKNRNGHYKSTSLSVKVEGWMHRKVAADTHNNNKLCSTLEIGAGTLNQLKYEKESKPYDIVEPFRELFENTEEIRQIRTVYNDIGEIDRILKYDRITSIAVFEHIMDLPVVVARGVLLLRADGCMRTAIPNEGTIIWKMGLKIPAYEFNRTYGLDYKVLMKYEHVNTADEIEEVIRHFFRKVKCSVLGVSRGLALLRFLEATEPDFEAAEKYLKERKLF
jgi:hypothetical protein